MCNLVDRPCNNGLIRSKGDFGLQIISILDLFIYLIQSYGPFKISSAHMRRVN